MSTDAERVEVVDRGGRLVRLSTRPGSAYTVLLLGGCGVPSYAWDPVVAALPGPTVVRLDRPGLVDTPWPDRLPSLAEEVATLEDVLDRLSGPVVLVGHSMGGPHAEAVVRHRGGVDGGVVLLDGSLTWSPRPGRGDRAWLAAARGVRRAMRLRLFQPAGPLADRLLVTQQSHRRFRDPADPRSRAVFRRPDAVASVIAEQAAYDQQLFDLAALRTGADWPAVPTVVLTAVQDGDDAWVADQRRLADLLGGRQVLVTDSRHLIMTDRPDLVADAVRSVAADVQQRPEEEA